MTSEIIVPDSLKDAEKVISKIHQILTQADLHRIFKIRDHDCISPGIHVAHITLSESDCSHLNFLSRYYARFGNSTHLKSHYFISNNEAPKELELTTTNRLKFVEACKLLAEVFDCQSVNMRIGQSWLWDTNHPQPDGSSTYRVIFQLDIQLRASNPFNAAQWLQSSYFDNICLSNDERADKCMFQHFKATTGKRTEGGSYAFNKNGVTMHFSSKEDRELAVEKSFNGCEVKILKRDKFELYPLEVIFPE